jgi:hypothetical protein
MPSIFPFYFISFFLSSHSFLTTKVKRFSIKGKNSLITSNNLKPQLPKTFQQKMFHSKVLSIFGTHSMKYFNILPLIKNEIFFLKLFTILAFMQTSKGKQ